MTTTKIILFSLTIFFLFLVANVNAQNPFNISFPVAELGNCGSVEECKTYCDDPANGEACLDFAEKNGLMKASEIKVARKVVGKTGPGGCQGIECQEYCEDVNHQDECFEFAASEGLIPEAEVKKIRQIKERVGTTRGPGGCRSESDCREYCEDIDHLEECLDFGVKAGLMTESEASKIRGIAGQGPGGCKGERACRNYCEDADHSDECLAFAEEHDLMPKEEIARARKLINQEGPGGCRGLECQELCEDEDNAEACLEFAEKNDLIPREELERAKKFINITGPGGCRGRQCQDFCSDSANQEECFEFAKKEGLIPQEEIEMMERGLKLQREVEQGGGPGGCRGEGECMDYCSDPSNTDECLNFAVEKGAFSKEEAAQQLEQFTKFREFGEKIRNNPGEFEFGGGDFDPGAIEEQFRQQIEEFGGPGGFDPAKMEKQFNFGPRGGRFGPQGFVPEGFLPEGVDIENLNPQEIEQQIRQQFESQGFGGGFPGRSGSFPGQTPGNFPGQGGGVKGGFPGQGGGEFPGGPDFDESEDQGFDFNEGNFPEGFHPPSPEDFEKFNQQQNRSGENFQPSQPGGTQGGINQQIQGEFQNQIQQQVEQQFQQEFNRQFEQQSGGVAPPPGGLPPPGAFAPATQPLGFILSPILDIFR